MSEPAWLMQQRKRGKAAFDAKPVDAPGLAPAQAWRPVPENISSDTAAAQRKAASVLAQSGVVFCGLAEALKTYPDLVERHLGSLVGAEEGGLASLNAALWRGGVFVYAPPGARPEFPLQADLYAGAAGAFSRTLIIAGEGSRLHYLEGCAAAKAPGSMLHAGVVEVIALAGAQVRFTTLQDWPDDLWNEPTKRAIVYEGASLRWVDGNLGSQRSVKRPLLRLAGVGARGDIVSCGAAGPGQTLVLGGSLRFEAQGCSGSVACRGVAWGGGALDFLAEKQGEGRAELSKDVLLLDRADPAQLFALMNLGLDERAAKALLAEGYCEPFARELPLESSVEFTRLLQIRLGGEGQS